MYGIALLNVLEILSSDNESQFTLRPYTKKKKFYDHDNSRGSSGMKFVLNNTDPLGSVFKVLPFEQPSLMVKVTGMVIGK